MSKIPLVDLSAVDLASLYDPDGWRSNPSRGLPGGRVKVRKAYGWDGFSDASVRTWGKYDRKTANAAEEEFYLPEAPGYGESVIDTLERLRPGLSGASGRKR